MNELTKQEKDVYTEIVRNGGTISEYARRHKISRQRVQLIIKNIKKKVADAQKNTGGVAGTSGQGGIRKDALYTNGPLFVTLIRLHGVAYVFRVHEPRKKFLALRERSDSVRVRGHKVILYRKSIVVYFEGSWYGDTPAKADKSFMVEFGEFLRAAPAAIGATIVKGKLPFYRRIKAHYAHTNNPLSKEIMDRGERVSVPGTADGKEWLTFDNSLQLAEAETTHTPNKADRRTSRQDMENVVIPVFNDYRDHPGTPLPSEQAATVAQLVISTNELTKALTVIVQKLTPQELPPDAQVSTERPDYIG